MMLAMHNPLRLYWILFASVVMLVLIASTTLQAQPLSWDNNDIISQATHGILKTSKGKFYEPTCNEEVAFDTEVIDLNKDGVPEVFTNYYGICLGGAAGVLVNLYIKNKAGQWIPNFGFPGTYTLLSSKNKGYPDVEIGGPGNCFPIWRWNGMEYDIYKKCER
jgi:hypothetical protein